MGQRREERMERWTQGAREDTTRWVNKAAKVKGQLLYRSRGAKYLFTAIIVKIVIKIWAFPNKNGQSGFAKYAITIRMLRKTFLFFMHDCEKIWMLS